MSDHLERLANWVNGAPEPAGVISHPRGDAELVINECRRLRQDVAAFDRIFSHDLAEEGGQFAAGVEHGAARMLAEVVALLDAEFLPTSRHRQVVSRVRALGPVRAPLPAERLAAENARLRDALRGLLEKISLSEGGILSVSNPPGMIKRVRAAYDALGEAPRSPAEDEPPTVYLARDATLDYLPPPEPAP